jgi:Icc-related predicted phosphoesterase
VSGCIFASDLHGEHGRYRRLFDLVARERPAAVFLGGDLLAGAHAALRGAGVDAFVGEFLEPAAAQLAAAGTRIFLVPGNDDARVDFERFESGERRGVWEIVHGRRSDLGGHAVYGYGCVPPTPFLLKDWERYDVSRFVDPGCVSPEEGQRTVPVEAREVRWGTIAKDLEQLVGDDPLERAVMLFHAPPHKTSLDRAALDGKTVDYVPVDVHVGSIAIRRFIERRQPLVTLHGHVHESARLTGSWREQFGRTHALSAAHDGPELAVVRFALDDPGSATRELLAPLDS